MPVAPIASRIEIEKLYSFLGPTLVLGEIAERFMIIAKALLLQQLL
jgi:hypothetical protein